jgi:hypothetical protein
MSPSTAADALLGLASVFALGAFWFGPMRWIATDWARDTMFAARDKIFDLAADGKISFDDPRYQLVRASINSSIRFAHGMNAGTLLLHRLHLLRVTDRELKSFQKPADRVREAISKITDPDTRRAFDRVLYRVDVATLHLLFWRSPFATLAFVASMIDARCLLSLRKGNSADWTLTSRFRPYAALIRAEAANS